MKGGTEKNGEVRGEGGGTRSGGEDKGRIGGEEEKGWEEGGGGRRKVEKRGRKVGGYKLVVVPSSPAPLYNTFSSCSTCM